MKQITYVPASLGDRQVAVGYRLALDGLAPLDRDFVNILPAAGLCTTAGDMAHLLVALTANLLPDGSQAFATSVQEALLQPQFSFHPSVPGRCYGFNEVFVNGRRALEQFGSWPGFNSLLMVFPRTGIGIFLVYNRNDGMKVARGMGRAFSGRFVSGVPGVRRASFPLFATQPLQPEYDGTYQAVRFARRTPFARHPIEHTVRKMDDGTIAVDEAKFRPIEPNVFERIDPIPEDALFRAFRVAFRVAPSGQVSHLLTDRNAFRRGAWYETEAARRMARPVVLLILASALIVWPIGAGLGFTRALSLPRAREARRNDLISSLTRGCAWLTAGVASWVVVSLMVVQLELDPFAYLYGMPPGVISLLQLGPVLLVLLLLTIGLTVIIWRQSTWKLAARLHHLLVIASVLVICLELYRRNLLL